jgi:hypothetical protein
MKCPHCNIEINSNFYELPIGKDSQGSASLFCMVCPNDECKLFIIKFARGKSEDDFYGPGNGKTLVESQITELNMIYPFLSTRPKAPIEVDEHISQDYNEACLVLSLSPKASAALSRRCLQNILREKAGVKPGNLIKEIEQVLADPKTPSYITESIDAVRNVGNFAAHPQKDQTSGEIIDVDPEEAEWLLDVLELLFDFYYVQPEIAKKKKAALDAKLALAGKPPMK